MTSISVTILLLGIGIGLVPNPHKLSLHSRRKLCENLAIQLCSTQQEQLPQTFKTLVPALVERNPEIRSMGFRSTDDVLIAQTENHSLLWDETAESKDTTYVQIPIMQEDRQLGAIEICFDSIISNKFYSILQSVHFPLIAFMSVLLFVIFHFYLKRALLYLDPSSVIPERVKSVLDTLTESVVVLDSQEQIVFANQAFAEITKKSETELMGRKLSGLPWIRTKTQQDTTSLPWQESLREGTISTNVPILLKDQSGETRHSLVNTAPIIGSDGKGRGIMASLTDVTEIEEKNKELIEMSRSAGMTEVATNVLHNIGNLLNSTNTLVSFIAQKLSESRLPKIRAIVDIITEHKDDLAAFWANDSRAQHIPSYLLKTTDIMLAEQDEIVNKVTVLQSNIDHLKETIRMQQTYARVQDCKTMVLIRELVEDTLQINHDKLKAGRISVVQEYDETDYLHTDGPLVLQILTNLIRNASEALESADIKKKQITIKCGKNGNGQFEIAVIDNGIGIPKENLDKVFRHGFTTKESGHGFGLHSSALNAQKAGGFLSVDSQGAGATFTLTLPLDSSGNDKEKKHGQEPTHISR